MTFDQLDLRSLISKRCDEERSRAEAGRGASNACEERERASPRSGAQRWPRSIDGPRAIIPGDIEPAGFDLSRKRRSSTRYANNGHAIMITSSARSRPEEEGGVEGQKFCVHSLSLSLTQRWVSRNGFSKGPLLKFSKKWTRLEGTVPVESEKRREIE